MKFSSEWIFTQRQAWEREVEALRKRGGEMPQERLDEMEKKFQAYEKDAWRFDQQIGKKTPGETEGLGADSLAAAVVAAVQALKAEDQAKAAATVTEEVQKAVPKKAAPKKAAPKKPEGKDAE